MKKSSTLFLKGVLVLIGLSALAVGVFALPVGIRGDETGLYRPIAIGLYLPMIPFFYALYQAWKLLTNIDMNKAFSDLSVTALKNIKYCAGIITAAFVVGMPYLFHVGDRDDAPGVIAVALVIIFASFVVAVFAAVLQSLMQSAIDIKSENDLTV